MEQMRFYSGVLLALCLTQIFNGTANANPTGYRSAHAFSVTNVPDVVKAMYDCLSQLLAAKSRSPTYCEGSTELSLGSKQGTQVGPVGRADDSAQSCLHTLGLPKDLDLACYYNHVIKVQKGRGECAMQLPPDFGYVLKMFRLM